MADAPEIKVKLTAEDTGVSAAIKELTSQLKNLKKQQDQTASSGISLKNAFQGIAAGALAIGLARIGKDALDAAAAIARASQVTGASVQTLTVFHKAAGDLSISTEAVDKGFVKLSRSILEFQQGGALVAKAFQALNISQKDLAGLNTDQKILLITNRLGSMKDSTTKAALAQQLLGRSGAQLIPVLNDLAGDGFENAREKAERFGLLLDNETQASMLAAKKAFQDLADVGKGMATQFEAGLVPALTDVANALVKTSEGGASGWQKIGQAIGESVKSVIRFETVVVDALIEMGGAIGIFAANAARATSDLFKKGAKGSWNEFKTGLVSDMKAMQDMVREYEDKTFIELGGATREKDVASEKAKAGQRARNAPPVIAGVAPTDAAAKALLAQYEKHLQDELTILRAAAKQADQIDAERFDKGEISLRTYFDHRRAEVTTDAGKERDILERGVALEIQAAQKAALAKQKAATPKDADKQDAIRIEALTKVEELQTKIRELEINSATKIEALNTEEFKKREENQNKILEFHKLVDSTQGNALEAAKAEIAIEQQKLQIILAQSGASQAQIDKELARYAQVKTAEVTFTEQQKDGANALKLLADQRAEIEDRVKNGQLFQVQGEEQIRAIEQARLPILQQIAAELLAQAKATGDEQKITQAEDFQKQVTQIQVQANTVGQQIATIKQGVQSSLTGGLNQFFSNMVQGTQSVGQAFKSLAGSVISSIGQMIAQMFIQIMVAKLLKAAMAGMSGGGLIPGGGGGAAFAEGGLIRGPGGPKSDSIPARVSPGEYIVKADAVSAFGVQNLEAINRGLKIPSLERLALPKFADGGLVGNVGGGGGDSNINLGIGLDEGLILKHLSSKAAANIVIQHLVNNPKAASKAISRSD